MHPTEFAGEPPFLIFTQSQTETKRKRRKSFNILRFCTPSGTRTLDPLIKSQLLYQLS